MSVCTLVLGTLWLDATKASPSAYKMQKQEYSQIARKNGVPFKQIHCAETCVQRMPLPKKLVV